MESRTITLQERCAKLECYNPAAIGKTFAMVKTMNDCLMIQEQGEPVLRAIAKQGEEESKKLSAMIFLNVAAFNKFLHLKNPLSNEEADFIVEQIIDEFGYALTMADVYVVFRNAKAGKYGSFYERLSAPDILGWFREYYSARLDAAEAYNLNKDRRQYRKGGENPLLALVYSMKDGRMVIDPEKVAAINERQKSEREAEAARIQRKIDEDNAYAKYKASFILKHIEEISTEVQHEEQSE